MDDAESEFLLKPGVYIDGKDAGFDQKLIKEYTKYAWYTDECSDLHPSKGKTIPDVHKKDAYSFCKASRYNGKAVEVGPLARMWVHNPELSPMGKKQLKDLFGIEAKMFRDLGEDMAFSLMGRHVARAEEAYMVANAIQDAWLKEVQPGEETYVKTEIPESAEGLGLTEAPRGSLLHYINIKDSKTANYQMIPATLWNSTPRDDKGHRGTIEEALVGTPVPDPKNPVDISRIIRSFDP